MPPKKRISTVKIKAKPTKVKHAGSYGMHKKAAIKRVKKAGETPKEQYWRKRYEAMVKRNKVAKARGIAKSKKKK